MSFAGERPRARPTAARAVSTVSNALMSTRVVEHPGAQRLERGRDHRRRVYERRRAGANVDALAADGPAEAAKEYRARRGPSFMSRRAQASVFAAVFLTLGGGCALVYDYTGEVSTLAATPDGGVVLAASFDLTATIANGTVKTAGLHDILVASSSADGTEMWALQLGDADDQLVHAVAVDPAGNVYLTGELKGQLVLGGNCGTQVASTTFSNGFLAQLDSSGACMWIQHFGANAYGSSLSADATGVTIGGAFTGPASFGPTMLNSPTKALFVARLTTGGTESLAGAARPGEISCSRATPREISCSVPRRRYTTAIKTCSSRG